jgi:hypothetical protein
MATASTYAAHSQAGESASRRAQRSATKPSLPEPTPRLVSVGFGAVLPSGGSHMVAPDPATPL